MVPPVDEHAVTVEQTLVQLDVTVPAIVVGPHDAVQ